MQPFVAVLPSETPCGIDWQVFMKHDRGEETKTPGAGRALGGRYGGLQLFAEVFKYLSENGCGRVAEFLVKDFIGGRGSEMVKTEDAAL